LNLLISTFLKRNKKTIGISLGLVFIFYLLNVLSELSEEIEGLKYLSIYTLADIRHIMSDTQINPSCIIVSIILSIIFLALSFIKYKKKELV
jgi:ABC-2 type transport system permease protein